MLSTAVSRSSGSSVGSSVVTKVEKRTSLVQHDGEEVELVEEVEYVDETEGADGEDEDDCEYIVEEVVEEYIEEVTEAEDEEVNEEVEDEDEVLEEDAEDSEKEKEHLEEEDVPDLPSIPEKFRRAFSTSSDSSVISTNVAVDGVNNPDQGGVDLDRLRPKNKKGSMPTISVPKKVKSNVSPNESASSDHQNKQNVVNEEETKVSSISKTEGLTEIADPTNVTTSANIYSDDTLEANEPNVDAASFSNKDVEKSVGGPSLTSEFVDYTKEDKDDFLQSNEFVVDAVPLENVESTVEKASSEISLNGADKETSEKPLIFSESTNNPNSEPFSVLEHKSLDAEPKREETFNSTSTNQTPNFTNNLVPASSLASDSPDADSEIAPALTPTTPLEIASTSSSCNENKSISSRSLNAAPEKENEKIQFTSSEQPIPSKTTTVSTKKSASVSKSGIVKNAAPSCGTDEEEYVQLPKIEWEKPSWTTAKLKSTEKGEVVKKGVDLQNPITHISKILEVVTPEVKEVDPSMKRLEWEKPDWTQTKLRNTAEGEKVKKIGDLQKAITHVEKNTAVDINFEANPVLLRPTNKGSLVRLGQNLAKPITHFEKDPMADVNFEANPHMMLKESVVGSVIKKGENLAKPITFIEKPIAADVNFVAHPALLKKTEKGEIVKTKGDLQKAITHVEKDTLDDINFEANPMILRPTPQGSAVRLGENLARPITHINKNIMADINFEANPMFSLQESDEGQSVMQGGSLAKPISTKEKETSDANFDANPALLKQSQKGSMIRTGREVTRPITYRDQINEKIVEPNKQTSDEEVTEVEEEMTEVEEEMTEVEEEVTEAEEEVMEADEEMAGKEAESGKEVEVKKEVEDEEEIFEDAVEMEADMNNENDMSVDQQQYVEGGDRRA